jgi:hypothetical protein
MLSFLSFCLLINTKNTSKSKANPTMKEKKDSSIGVGRVFLKSGKSANQAVLTGNIF